MLVMCHNTTMANIAIARERITEVGVAYRMYLPVSLLLIMKTASGFQLLIVEQSCLISQSG